MSEMMTEGFSTKVEKNGRGMASLTEQKHLGRVASIGPRFGGSLASPDRVAPDVAESLELPPTNVPDVGTVLTQWKKFGQLVV